MSTSSVDDDNHDDNQSPAAVADNHEAKEDDAAPEKSGQDGEEFVDALDKHDGDIIGPVEPENAKDGGEDDDDNDDDKKPAAIDNTNDSDAGNPNDQKKFYAVRRGRLLHQCILFDWESCRQNVQNDDGSTNPDVDYEAFDSLEEAQAYLKGDQAAEGGTKEATGLWDGQSSQYAHLREYLRANANTWNPMHCSQHAPAVFQFVVNQLQPQHALYQRGLASVLNPQTVQLYEALQGKTQGQFLASEWFLGMPTEDTTETTTGKRKRGRPRKSDAGPAPTMSMMFWNKAVASLEAYLKAHSWTWDVARAVQEDMSVVQFIINIVQPQYKRYQSNQAPCMLNKQMADKLKHLQRITTGQFLQPAPKPSTAAQRPKGAAASTGAKRGRPKGGKKRTSDGSEQDGKRKRGRPKGSVNKAKDAAASSPDTPKRRGRPPKNPLATAAAMLKIVPAIKSPHKLDKRWQESWTKAKDYMDAHNGQWNVVEDTTEDAVIIRRWIIKQISDYAKCMQGLAEFAMTREKLDKLRELLADELVAPDAVGGKPRTPSSSKNAALHKTWLESYERLQKFMEAHHGEWDVDVPEGQEGYQESVIIKRWVNSQKYEYYRRLDMGDPMTEEKVTKLRDLNIDLTTMAPDNRVKTKGMLVAMPGEEWNMRMEQLREHRAQRGTCRMAKGENSTTELGQWVTNLRKYAREEIPEQRLAELDAMGFYEAHQSHSWNSEFDSMMNKLRQFKSEHGDCYVKQIYKDTYPELFAWVQKVRREYERLSMDAEKEDGDDNDSNDEEGGRKKKRGRKSQPSRLTALQLQRLNQIGFVFKKRSTFEQRVEDLRAFQATGGDINNISPFYPVLGEFVRRNRRDYRDMLEGRRKSSMTEERVAVLEEMGFDWKQDNWQPRRPQEDNRKAKTFDERFVELEEYRKTHGHTLVEKPYPGGLDKWVYEQRRQMRRLGRGEYSTLTAEKAARLSSIGFAVNPVQRRGTKRDPNRTSTAAQDRQRQAPGRRNDDESSDDEDEQQYHQFGVARTYAATLPQAAMHINPFSGSFL